LQPRSQVRGVADDAALLRLPRSDEVADDDQAGRDPDPHAQRRSRRGDEFRRSLDDREPGLHGALGVVFVGLRIAEIGEHPVADVFGDEATVALDRRRAAAMVGADDLAHVLGIEPRGECGRADEIAEHHREMAALGGVLRRRWGRGARRLGWAVRRAESGDRLEQAFTVTQGDAKLSEIAFVQVDQNVRADRILAERVLVLTETEAPQPIPDVHDQIPAQFRR